MGMQTGMGARSQAEGSGWPIPGALPDLDFANNRWFGVSSFAAALSVTRTSPSDYAEKLDGSWQSFAAGGARVTDKGLLVEESRVNSIANNSMQGAVSGSPGTMPTGWGSNNGGLTRTIVGTGVQNGIDYIDIRLSGTTAATFALIEFASTAAIAASAAQVWTQSIFCAIVGGSLTNITNVQTVLREVGAGGTAAANMSLTSTPTRQPAATRTLGASVTNVWPTLTLLFSSGVAVDITLRIGWPQLELGATATSPIRTTAGAVTRQADAISVNNSSSYITANASGIYLKVRPRIVSGGGTRTFASVVVDASNQHSFYVNTSTGTFNFSTLTAAASQYVLSSTSGMVADTSYKTSARWQANSAALRVPTALTSPANNTSNTQPTGTPTIWLGSLSGSSLFANGYIERVAFFSAPPADAVLNALVA
jgi:hypothetical protein